MNLNFDTIYQNLSVVFKDGVIDLSGISFFDPWAIGMICLKAIENKDSYNKNLILPKKLDTKKYLKRMHLHKFMQEITYDSFLDQFREIDLRERDNLNIHEILHCHLRDQFNACLDSTIRRMFKSFGMSDADEQRATALVGELGNNVFDHNEGSWPTDIRGAIIIAQKYPQINRIDVLVADPGVGFRASLRCIENPPNTDVQAIKLGLQGVTGRIGEKRGNGLPLIQDWTINHFEGILRIHSGNGLVITDKNGQKAKSVNKILGTLAELVVLYK